MPRNLWIILSPRNRGGFLIEYRKGQLKHKNKYFILMNFDILSLFSISVITIVFILIFMNVLKKTRFLNKRQRKVITIYLILPVFLGISNVLFLKAVLDLSNLFYWFQKGFLLSLFYLAIPTIILCIIWRDKKHKIK